eukprot:240055-Prorocentrum_minimum.AAC.3
MLRAPNGCYMQASARILQSQAGGCYYALRRGCCGQRTGPPSAASMASSASWRASSSSKLAPSCSRHDPPPSSTFSASDFSSSSPHMRVRKVVFCAAFFAFAFAGSPPPSASCGRNSRAPPSGRTHPELGPQSLKVTSRIRNIDRVLALQCALRACARAPRTEIRNHNGGTSTLRRSILQLC